MYNNNDNNRNNKKHRHDHLHLVTQFKLQGASLNSKRNQSLTVINYSKHLNTLCEELTTPLRGAHVMLVGPTSTTPTT